MSNTNIKLDVRDVIVSTESMTDQVSAITNEMNNALSIPDDKLGKIDYIEYSVELVPRIKVKMHLK